MGEIAGLLERLGHSVVHRPYVFLPFAVFVVIATWQLGLARVLLMVPGGYAVAWLSELSSIHTGFPYGRYSYLPEGMQGDLLVLGVPFFDSLSYTFLAYFSWGTALLLLGPLEVRRGLDVRLAGADEVRRSPGVLGLGALLMTWIDLVVDPVAARGERWFLGRIFAYEREGAWFGVPLSNFAGWLLVASAILFVWQRVDAIVPPGPLRRRVPGQALYAPGMYLAIVGFGLSIALALGEVGVFWAGLALHGPVGVWVGLRVRGASTGRGHTGPEGRAAGAAQRRR